MLAGGALGPIVIALIAAAGARWRELAAVAGVAVLIVLGGLLRGPALWVFVALVIVAAAVGGAVLAL